MVECCGSNCDNSNQSAYTVNGFRLHNDMWSDPGATQCITNFGDGRIGWHWNKPNHTSPNYPEIIIGSNCEWPSSVPGFFPVLQKNINTFYSEVEYKFTKVPTDWPNWNLAYDIYWRDSSCNAKLYNIMIWPIGDATPYGKQIVNDGINDYYYTHDNRGWPWDVFILKNQPTLVVNQVYTHKVNIKALIDTINNNEFRNNGDWQIPGIEFGDEIYLGSGSIEISQFNIELNGQWRRLNSAPTTKYRCTGSPNYQCVTDPNGPYNSLAACQTACKVLQIKNFNIHIIGTPNKPTGVLVTKNIRGDYTTDEACKLTCDTLKIMDQ